MAHSIATQVNWNCNVYNRNESILSNKFSKQFTQPIKSENQKNSIDY